MRGGINTIQVQALAIEAEAIVKQAINLARRRGHAHVTPLHVATAMLISSSSSLLRSACLHSHSHPLQCKALELCFNVALNRLPASMTPASHLFAPHYPNPCLSNALVAAFKRAQAQQRRGTAATNCTTATATAAVAVVDTQQQQQHHILAMKIELEQLIISILDDPSVSRVMREAGFNSTQVKNRVQNNNNNSLSFQEEYCNNDRSDNSGSANYFGEKKCNLLPTNTPITSRFQTTKPQILSMNSSVSFPNHHHHHHRRRQLFGFGRSVTPAATTKVFDDEADIEQDINSVLEELSNTVLMERKTRNTVIVGESLGTVESIIRGVMGKFERGDEDIPNELKYVEFLSLPLFSLRNLSKDEIEKKLMELKGIVKSCMGRRVILYLGDLNWVSEFWSNSCYNCSPVEDIIMEIKRLIDGENINGRFWVLGIATFQIYMRCKAKAKAASHPSLESLWSLHPLTLPLGTFTLTLNLQSSSKLYNIESTSPTISAATALPSCLEQFNEDARKKLDEQDFENRRNSFYGVEKEKAVRFCSSKSNSDHHHHHHHQHWVTNLIPNQSPIEYQFWVNSKQQNDVVSSSKPDLLSNPNSSPNSASSSEVEISENNSRDRDLPIPTNNSESWKLISDSLLKTIPNLQKQKSMEISTAILNRSQQSCWLFFLGNDNETKEKTAIELARLFFGSSQTNTKFISMSRYNSTDFNGEADITKMERMKKRRRSSYSSDDFGFRSYLQRFAEAVNENPHRVFFMEDFDFIDYSSLMGFKRAIQNGNLLRLSDNSNGDDDHEVYVDLKDAIIIFSGGDETTQFNNVKQEDEDEEDDDDGISRNVVVSLDLNMGIEGHHRNKRGANRDNALRMIMESVDGKIYFS